jgi:hypothetical protein
VETFPASSAEAEKASLWGFPQAVAHSLRASVYSLQALLYRATLCKLLKKAFFALLVVLPSWHSRLPEPVACRSGSRIAGGFSSVTHPMPGAIGSNREVESWGFANLRFRSILYTNAPQEP